MAMNIMLGPANAGPRDTIGRFLQRPDLMAGAPAAVVDVAGGPRAANAALQSQLELAGSNVSAGFSGKVSLFFLALLILVVMAFTYWTRGFQL